MGHRDLKNSSRPARASASRKHSGGGGGVMMGVIIGLIVGVAAVVGVVMYFSKAGTPFTNLQKQTHAASSPASSSPTQILSPGITLNDASSADGPVEAPPVQAARPTASQPAPSAAAAPATTPAKPAAPANGKDKSGQRFDFYKILPGQVEAVTADGTSSASTHDDHGARKPYLQLGSFQNQDDADNLKAKLALIGVEATIQSADVPGKGIVHRVRVGPFSTPADADRVRSLLKQNGIGLGARPAN